MDRATVIRARLRPSWGLLTRLQLVLRTLNPRILPCFRLLA
jgi:hypothetical protein